MKKYLIFSIILISSFFIYDKVKAVNYETFTYVNEDLNIDFSYDIDIDTFPYYFVQMVSSQNNYYQIRVYKFTNEAFLHNCTNISCYVNFTPNNTIYRYYYNFNNGVENVETDGYYDINIANMYTKINPYTYVYDDNGNLSSYLINHWSSGVLLGGNFDIYEDDNSFSAITGFNHININDFINNNGMTRGPEATYEIEDGSNYGKKLIFHFSNFDSNSYFTITNISSGTTFTIDDLSDTTDYFVDDISYDSVFYVEAYNNDELVFVDTIDINQDLVLNGSPYIDLVLDKGRLISYLEFYELKSSYKVYYSINNGTFNEVQVQSGNNHVLVAFTNDMPEIHNTNYTIRGQIRDSEDNILYDKSYNIVFFDNLPYFTFKTSYNNNTGCNEVNITYHNYQSGDIVQYSYDNSSFNNFSYDRYEYLDVCSNSPIYTKAVRGNNTYYGYFYVNVMEYESTSNEQYYSYNGDLFSTFNSLFNGVDISFLNNISSTWNSLKSTYVFKFILLCIVGAMILFIMKLIRR